MVHRAAVAAFDEECRRSFTRDRGMRRRHLELVAGLGLLLGPLVYALTLEPTVAEPVVIVAESSPASVEVCEPCKQVEPPEATEPPEVTEPHDWHCPC